jgi:serine protease inhibitor
MSGHSGSYSANQHDDMFRKQNNPKRNKLKMVCRNNDKIAQRGDDDADINNSGYKSRMNIDRIMLERQMTTHNFEEEEDKYIGEVTGEELDGSDIFDKGMPLRSNFTVKRSKYDDNSHLDFDLYQKIDKHKSDTVGYADSSGADFAGLDEAMKSITKGADPYETCISDINSTTCWMHSNMFVFSREDYVMNGFGLFSGFGVLYLISRGNTELELKNYFNFQDKKHLNAGLLTIREDMNRFRDQIAMDSYLLNDKDIPSNMNAAKKLKSLIFSVIINRDYPDEEAQRVNNIIKTVSGMKDVVSSGTIAKSNISMISVCRLTPVWAYRVDNIVKGRFRGLIANNGIEMMDFIRFMGKTFDYYEDAERQLIEIPMHGETYVIGLVLSKSNEAKPTELKGLSVSINYLKPTVLDEVMIPVIAKRYKIRMNKTLQKTGLNVVFSDQEMIGLFSEGGTLDDCLQYVDLSFGTQCGKKRCDNKGYRTTRKFIANRDFEFYLRNRENNYIAMMGRI